MLRLIVCVFVYCVGLYAAPLTYAPIVRTSNGDVQGIIKQYNGSDVYQYVGIPYAAPPVDELRFKKPQVHANWTGTYNATHFMPSCMQHLFQNDKWLIPNKAISENCLHLNIYISWEIKSTAPRAVMIWIHGGGFTAGQGMLFDASYLALQGDVIVVTLNYRVGLFGFLSTEDEHAIGNYGLYDQKLAIEWIKNNIKHFGGDPSKLCIFGESAGGYSVGLQSMSPLNRGLFQRAISESGAVFSPRALAHESKKVALAFGRLVNCSMTETEQLIQCLRSRKAVDLLNKQDKAIYGSEKNQMTFVNRLGPVIDGELVAGDPAIVLDDEHSESFKTFRSIDIMTGTNNAEGGLLYFRLKGYQEQYNYNINDGVPAKLLCHVIAPAVARDYYNGDTNVSQAICEKYNVSGGSLSAQGRSAVDIYADIQFVIPTIKTNIVHSTPDRNFTNKYTFHYIFTHQPSFSWIQERPPWLEGANHAGELPFVFGPEAMYPNTNEKPEDEVKLSKQMMVYWSNFAKSGNPNAPNTNVPINWPPYTTAQQDYLNISIPLDTGRHLYEDKFDFWTQRIPSIMETSSNTASDVHGTTSNSAGKSGGRKTPASHLSLPVLCAILLLIFCQPL